MADKGREEIEVIIGSDGKVNVTVKGMPGKACLEHEQTLAEVGRVIAKDLTPEYYQAEVAVEERQRVKARRS